MPPTVRAFERAMGTAATLSSCHGMTTRNGVASGADPATNDPAFVVVPRSSRTSAGHGVYIIHATAFIQTK